MTPSFSSHAEIPLWREVQRKNFTRIEPLADFLHLSPGHRARLLSSPMFSLNIPERLAAKIVKNSLDDPIFLQFVPLQEEMTSTPGFVPEPLQDQLFRKCNKLLKKYHNRALFLTTSACAMHCRFCFRQNFPYETEERGFEKELSYLKKDETISEVILSGGDPLSLSTETLAKLFSALEQIPHIRRIRFHTRFPIGIPERIDELFLKLLASSSKQIVFIIHCNHPRELDADVLAALKKIQCLGIPLLNQSVLLQGVNDDEQTLLALSEALTNGGIIPYYLHQMDRVQGGAHFTVSDEKAISLIRFLQENESGYGVPRLVREEPGHLSKTDLLGLHSIDSFKT